MILIDMEQRKKEEIGKLVRTSIDILSRNLMEINLAIQQPQAYEEYKRERDFLSSSQVSVEIEKEPDLIVQEEVPKTQEEFEEIVRALEETFGTKLGQEEKTILKESF